MSKIQGAEDRARIVDVEDVKAVIEVAHFQHGEEGGLELADLDGGLQEGHFDGDLNHTTANLDGNSEDLEHGGLLGPKVVV